MTSGPAKIIHISRWNSSSSRNKNSKPRSSDKNNRVSFSAGPAIAGTQDNSTHARKSQPAIAQQLAIYVANFLIIGGAVAISLAPNSASSPLAFFGFLIGHLCFAMHSARLRDRGLIFLNAALACLDLYAIAIRL